MDAQASTNFGDNKAKSMIHVSIQGIHSRISKSRTENIDLSPNDSVALILQQVQRKTSKRICALSFRGKFINPFSPRTGPLSARVVPGQSVYSLAKGLEINVNETCETFYENLINYHSAGYGKSEHVHIDDNSVKIVDHGLNEPVEINISFARTLRVPEDGRVYGVPQIFATTPVMRMENARSDIPVDMVGNEDIFIPLYEEEALAINFSIKSTSRLSGNQHAIKVLPRTMNLTKEEASTGNNEYQQDYVIVPAQVRLDGFLCSGSLVKQFVAMAPGLDDMVEDRRTRVEHYGGFQLLIASRIRGRGDFGRLRKDLSPIECGQRPGDYISVSGSDLELVSRSIESLPHIFKTIKDNLASPVPRNYRPKLVHEMLQELNLEGASAIVLDLVYPFSISIVEQAQNKYLKVSDLEPGLAISSTTKKLRNAGTVIASPFMSLATFTALLKEHLRAEFVVFYEEGRSPINPASLTSNEIHELISGSCRIVCQTYKYRHGYNTVSETHQTRLSRAPAIINELPRTSANVTASRYDMILSNLPQHDLNIHVRQLASPSLKYPHEILKGPAFDVRTGFLSASTGSNRNGDLGLAGGGCIEQAILRDLEPEAWNWDAARSINVQFVNVTEYERITGFRIPPYFVSVKDHVTSSLLPSSHVEVPKNTMATDNIIVGENNLYTLAELPISHSPISTASESPHLDANGIHDLELASLHAAVRHGSADLVLDLLEQGHDPNGVESLVETPTDDSGPERAIHIAARLGHCNVVAPLHEYGANLDAAAGSLGYLPIHEAAAHGQDSFLLLLLMLGKSVTSPTAQSIACQRLTPDLVAAKHGHLKTLNLLLRKRASGQEATADNAICSSNAESRCTNRGTHATLDIPSCHMRSPLHQAAVHGHNHIISYLLSAGAIADHRVVPGGVTPLLCAAKHGNFDTVKHLVHAGADVESEWMGHTPLAFLLDQATWPRNCALDTFEALLKAGAASGTLSPQGTSAMHIAARTGDTDVLNLFFRGGVDVDIMSVETKPVSPLSTAFAHGQLQSCSLLMSKNATFHGATCEHLFHFVHSKNSNSRPLSTRSAVNLTFDERWRLTIWRTQTLEEFVHLLVIHRTNIQDVPLFLSNLAFLKQYDLIDKIRTHYISEDKNHPTAKALIDFTSHDLVYRLSLESSNNVVVEELLTHWRAKPDAQKSAYSSSQSLSAAIAEAAQRDDYDMLNAILSTINPDVAAVEASVLEQHLSPLEPRSMELRNYVRNRYRVGR